MERPKIECTTGGILFLCIYGLWDPYGSFLPFILCICLHELGHILSLLCLQEKIRAIQLGFGGVTIYTAPLPYLKEIIIAAAGPLVTLGLLLTVGSRNRICLIINLCLLLYNMLPFYPLDGGRICRCILRLMFPITQAERIEKAVTIGTYSFLLIGCILCSICYNAGLWFMILWAVIYLRTGGGSFLHHRL